MYEKEISVSFSLGREGQCFEAKGVPAFIFKKSLLNLCLSHLCLCGSVRTACKLCDVHALLWVSVRAVKYGTSGSGLRRHASCIKLGCLQIFVSTVPMDYAGISDLLCCKKYAMLMSPEV